MAPVIPVTTGRHPRLVRVAGQVLLPACLACLPVIGCFASHESADGRQAAAGTEGTEWIAQGGYAGRVDGQGGAASTNGAVAAGDAAAAGGDDGPSSSQAGTAGSGTGGETGSGGAAGVAAAAPFDPVTEIAPCPSADVLPDDIDPLSCKWTIPPVPDGEVIDPDRVNFEYRDPAGKDGTFPMAASATQCEDMAAWYYPDRDDPVVVAFCPAACRGIIKGEYTDIRMVTGCFRLPL